MTIKKGDIVQANERADEWFGCILYVDEVTENGVLAGFLVPGKGAAFRYFKPDELLYVGQAHYSFGTE